jgi:hypothetical protein
MPMGQDQGFIQGGSATAGWYEPAMTVDHGMNAPPFTWIVCPVMNRADGEQR